LTTVFLRPKTALTWGFSNIKLPILRLTPYKLYSEQIIRGQKIVTCGFGGPLCTGHVILRMRIKLCIAFTMGKRHFRLKHGLLFVIAQ